MSDKCPDCLIEMETQSEAIDKTSKLVKCPKCKADFYIGYE